MKLLDHYSQFRRAIHTCKHCGWRGSGAMMKNGSHYGLGIDKHCPKCGERLGVDRTVWPEYLAAEGATSSAVVAVQSCCRIHFVKACKHSPPDLLF